MLTEPRRRPGAPAQKVSAARAAAFEILLLVAAQRGHSDELLHGRHLRGLTAADRNLATALVLGVLRWQVALDARLRPLLSRPEAKLAEPVSVALRMGAFQLLHMDRIPPHAALSESVELARLAGHPHAASMVNAVLRKLSALPPPGVKLHESTAAFAERLGHPLWLVERWTEAYGRAAALAICEADQREPACGTLFVEEDITMPVMDDGSRLVAELASACAPAAERVWDCCAAPGGKTIVLAKRLPGAALLATDVSPRRLEALGQRLQETGVTARTVLADAARLPEEEGKFDLILCDVPCSGTGTLRRNPEIRHRLQPAGLQRQGARQREILAGALLRLSPGGKLVYSTCSLEREENEQVVDTVTMVPGVRRLDVREALAGVSGRLRDGLIADGLMRHGYLRTLPGAAFEGDGFFAAVLERDASSCEVF